MNYSSSLYVWWLKCEILKCLSDVLSKEDIRPVTRGPHETTVW